MWCGSELAAVTVLYVARIADAVAAQWFRGHKRQRAAGSAVVSASSPPGGGFRGVGGRNWWPPRG